MADKVANYRKKLSAAVLAIGVFILTLLYSFFQISEVGWSAFIRNEHANLNLTVAGHTFSISMTLWITAGGIALIPTLLGLYEYMNAKEKSVNQALAETGLSKPHEFHGMDRIFYLYLLIIVSNGSFFLSVVSKGELDFLVAFMGTGGLALISIGFREQLEALNNWIKKIWNKCFRTKSKK